MVTSISTAFIYLIINSLTFYLPGTVCLFIYFILWNAEMQKTFFSFDWFDANFFDNTITI